MAQRNYPRLSIYEFGEHLLTSGDLDPVYIALHRADWQDVDHLYRWLVAYWCFYHCGAASYISEAQGEEFWERMRIASENTTPSPLGERWPRGSERRHFRGDQSNSAVAQMRARYPRPAQIIQRIAHPYHDADLGEEGPPLERLPFELVSSRARGLPRFGPWIAFKVADMLDRLGIAPVDFDHAAVFMFDDPAKAALKLWRQHERLPDTAEPKDWEARTKIIKNVVAHLSDYFKDHTAPPIHERPVGLQEIETILCKWKSMMNGHYAPYNDINEIRHGLEQWSPHSETARTLLHAMPEGKPGATNW